MNTNPRQIDKYTLQELLGSGGMAEVWKAWDNQLERYVAIKLLHADLQNDPDFITRFEQEARLIASLRHSNIIQIYDFRVSRAPETGDTLVYMVMEYVEGQTLAQYLRNVAQQNMLPPYSALISLFAPICLAVDYAHQKGMIHRDIKPSNILLDGHNTTRNPMGEPILTDFGIARLLGASSTMHSGWRLGTPSYISPEQVIGSPGTERSDIYALSVILYEACTGIRPFRGDNPASVMMQHVHANPVAPALINPNIPPVLAATILQGLAKDPNDRFPTASALCIALSEAVNVPLPEGLKTAIYQTAEMGSLTYIKPRSTSSPSLPPIGNITPIPASNPLLPFAGNITPLPPINPSLPAAADVTPVLVAQNITPQADSPEMSSLSPLASTHLTSKANSDRHPGILRAPVLMPLLQNITLPPLLAKQRLSKKVLARVLAALAILIVSLSALLLLTPHNSTPPAVAAPTIIGHAAFVSSGQLNSDNSQGINDEVILEMHNIPAPPAGTAYYAWLLGDKIYAEPLVTALGRLPLNNGNVYLFYKGNTSHANLLATESRILITEENVSSSPVIYTPNTKFWAYYAELPQTPNPRDQLHFSMLDHLRHLLSNSPELQTRKLYGGLDMWLLRNTQKILEWSNAARDDWRTSPDLLHRQIVRVLDYIDGASYVRQDAPAVGPVLLSDAHDAQIALLGPSPDEPIHAGYTYEDDVPPGYVYLVSAHLDAAVLSPGATQSQRDQAAQIHVALDQVKGWFEQVHQDAKQLVAMNTQQLGQPQALSLLNDMVTKVQLAYTGQDDPWTGQQQGGVIWICNGVQHLAIFNLQPYKAS
jgi:serine/threonine protein kinase